LANRQALRGDNVAALAVGIAQEGNVGRPVRVVFQALHFGRDTVLVPFEVHQSIVLLVSATLVPCRDMTVVVAAGVLGLWFKQPGHGRTLVQRVIDHLDNSTATR
jgi:hypothetical protein